MALDTAMNPVVDLAKGDARRLQVLTAAKRCFCKHGFHGTSILRISQEAGMSPGHIYHYFRNKEAIVAGIVEDILRDTLDRVSAIRLASRTSGVVEACLATVDDAIAMRAHPDRVSLDLEILAEAARNPAVADLVRHADAVARLEMLALLRSVPALAGCSTVELEAKITVMNMLFDGLISRSILNPEFQSATAAAVVKGILRDVLEGSARPA